MDRKSVKLTYQMILQLKLGCIHFRPVEADQQPFCHQGGYPETVLFHCLVMDRVGSCRIRGLLYIEVVQIERVLGPDDAVAHCTNRVEEVAVEE